MLYISNRDHNSVRPHFLVQQGIFYVRLFLSPFQVATQLGKYVITMMSSGVVLGVGFQLSGLSDICTALPLLYTLYLSFHSRTFSGLPLLSQTIFLGGDSQMNELIWYSWLGGVIIGTMIGTNSVLEEHCKAGPRNVVITGR
jgi:chlorophyll(ide) b reductase